MKQLTRLAIFCVLGIFLYFAASCLSRKMMPADYEPGAFGSPETSAPMSTPAEGEETGVTETRIAQLGDENSSPGAGPRLVIYVGRIGLLVENISFAIESIRETAESMGGYMQEMGLNWITIKVPAAKFEEAVARVEKLGEVTRREIKGTDVTDQMMDLKIRLNNAEEFRKRLIKLLDKAVKVEDILKIEKELERVTETIEVLKGRIKYLEHNVAFSTLTVELNSPIPQRRIASEIPFKWVRALGSELTSGGAEISHPSVNTWNRIKFELPESYVLYYQENYQTYAMSADNTIIKVKRHDNYEGGTLEFWHKLVRRQLTAGRAFSIKEELDITLDTKASAKMLAATKEMGGETYGYIIALVVSDDYVYTYEAWGLENNLSADRSMIEKSIRSMSIRP